MTEVQRYIQKFLGAQKDELAKIGSLFTSTFLVKGAYFLRKGRRSTPGYFIVDVSSFIFQLPARWNLQVIFPGIALKGSKPVRMRDYIAGHLIFLNSALHEKTLN